MHIRAEPDIVGQVPAGVIGIFINHDLIAVPQPAAAVSGIVRRNVKVKSTKPESAGTPARQAPDVAFAEAAAEMPVLKGMVEVVMRIAGAAIVADPFVARSMDVRRLRMPRPVGETWMLGRRRGIFLGSARWRGAVRGNVSAADALHTTPSCAAFMPASFLRHSGQRQKNGYRKESDELSHFTF